MCTAYLHHDVGILHVCAAAAKGQPLLYVTNARSIAGPWHAITGPQQVEHHTSWLSRRRGHACIQVDLKRRADEIEKKTQEVDLLNRKYEKIVAGQQGGPETGQLAASGSRVALPRSRVALPGSGVALPGSRVAMSGYRVVLSDHISLLMICSQKHSIAVMP